MDFGGLDQCFGLEVRFDTRETNSACYGYECWKVFWQNFDRSIFDDMMAPKFYLLSGDCDANVFSICIETLPFPKNADYIDKLENTLANDSNFAQVAASPRVRRYQNAMAMQPFAPFLKTLNIEWGKLYIEDEGIAADAMNALDEVHNISRAR